MNTPTPGAAPQMAAEPDEYANGRWVAHEDNVFIAERKLITMRGENWENAQRRATGIVECHNATVGNDGTTF